MHSYNSHYIGILGQFITEVVRAEVVRVEEEVLAIVLTEEAEVRLRKEEVVHRELAVLQRDQDLINHPRNLPMVTLHNLQSKDIWFY